MIEAVVLKLVPGFERAELKFLHPSFHVLLVVHLLLTANDLLEQYFQEYIRTDGVVRWSVPGTKCRIRDGNLVVICEVSLIGG